MNRTDIRFGFALIALMVVAGNPAAAEEQDFKWLGSVGEFVLKGLGPPRTLEDIRREEQRERDLNKPWEEPETARPEPGPAEPTLAAPAQIAPLAVAKPAPDIKPAPERKKAEAKRVESVPATAPAANAGRLVMPMPEAKPMPVPQAKPKVVPVRAPVPPPPPEPLTNRIADTATLDQAVKLGGSADIYSGHIKKPVRN